MRGGVVALLALAAAGAILSLQLFVHPIVGLANNGDFEKVMGYAGFQYLPGPVDEHFYSWIQTRFAIAPPGWHRSGYLTSETLLALTARGAAMAGGARQIFDLRILGAVHTLVFLIALGLLAAASRGLPPAARIVGLLCFVVAFTDVGYAAAFNSFYSQTASFVFLLATLGIAALGARRGRTGLLSLVAYFACAALFVASKPQESLQGPLLALFGLRLAALGRKRAGAFAWVLALGLCSFSTWYFLQTPAEYRRLAKYGAIFGELVPRSPSPAADLRELGLNPELERFGGQSAYPADFPKEELDRVGYPGLLRFYLFHPARLTGVVSRAAPSAFVLRPPALGNFEKSTGLPARAKSDRFDFWSSARRRLAPHATLALMLLFAAGVVTALLTRRRSDGDRLASDGILLLAAMAVIEFGVCVLADSLNGLPRHLFLFQALIDLLALSVLVRWLATVRTSEG